MVVPIASATKDGYVARKTNLYVKETALQVAANWLMEAD